MSIVSSSKKQQQQQEQHHPLNMAVNLHKIPGLVFHGQHFTARIIATAIAADDNVVVVVLVLRRQHFNDEHRRNINGVYDEPFTVA